MKPQFHNKGLSLTALSVVPFWNHLAFRLSSLLKLFCQEKRSTYAAAVRHLQGPPVCQNKRKTKGKENKEEEKKKKDQTSELAELSTAVYSEATVSVSDVSGQRLG